MSSDVSAKTEPPRGDEDPAAPVDLPVAPPLTRSLSQEEAAKLAGTTIEIVIVMDCTGSMGSWISAAKATSLSTVKRLRAAAPEAKFRLGFVGYRDFCDSDRFVDVPLSEDVQAVESQLQGVHASGGGDTCEDMAGGLRHAVEMNWSTTFDPARDTRIVICVADAPPHGSKYHDLMCDDNYPKRDPDNSDIEATIRLIASRHMDFYFMRITPSTDACIRVFNDVYTAAAASDKQSFVVLNLANQPGTAPPSMPMPVAAEYEERGMPMPEIESSLMADDGDEEGEALAPPPPPGGLTGFVGGLVGSVMGGAPGAAVPRGGPPKKSAIRERRLMAESARPSAAMPSAPAMAMAAPSAAASTSDAYADAIFSSVMRSAMRRV